MTAKRRAIGALVIGLAVGAACLPATGGEVVLIESAKDNTLYEPDPDFPDDIRSNGAGEYFFAGMTARMLARRGVIAFDVAGAVPDGATITSVQLVLHMSRTLAGDEPVALHALLADWGEGDSDALEEEGAPAEPGDATWLHRFFDAEAWDAEGGDFRPTASALAVIGDVGFYTWGSTEALVADAQAWLDAPEQNFGWLLLGNEESPFTAKRFDTRENLTVEHRPVLRVEYVPGPGAGAVALLAAVGLRRRRR